jgi:hypothetical protein
VSNNEGIMNRKAGPVISVFCTLVVLGSATDESFTHANVGSGAAFAPAQQPTAPANPLRMAQQATYIPEAPEPPRAGSRGAVPPAAAAPAPELPAAEAPPAVTPAPTAPMPTLPPPNPGNLYPRSPQSYNVPPPSLALPGRPTPAAANPAFGSTGLGSFPAYAMPPGIGSPGAPRQPATFGTLPPPIPAAVTQKPFSNYTAAPAVSPYINLFRSNSLLGTAANYYGLVRPQVQQQSFNQQAAENLSRLGTINAMQQTQIQSLQQQNQLLLEGRLQGSPFTNYLHYYPGLSR